MESRGGEEINTVRSQSLKEGRAMGAISGRTASVGVETTGQQCRANLSLQDKLCALQMAEQEVGSHQSFGA